MEPKLDPRPRGKLGQDGYLGDYQRRMIVVQSEPEEGTGEQELDEKRVLTSVTLHGREILVGAEAENHDWYSRYRSANRPLIFLPGSLGRLTLAVGRRLY